MSCDAACVALLRRLPNLCALHLSGAEMELSRHSLAHLSLLAPTLTSLVIHQVGEGSRKRGEKYLQPTLLSVLSVPCVWCSKERRTPDVCFAFPIANMASAT